jgi:hypothetical protein
MDDQLDNDLKNRIREVFDNYEDTTADEGWLLLREKFPVEEKKRPMVWLWWASTAAVLLLFLGIGMWILDKKTGTSGIAVKPVKHQHQPKNATTQDTATQLAITQQRAIKNSPVDTAVSIQTPIAKNIYPSVKSPNVNNSAVNTATARQNAIAIATANPSKNLPVTSPAANQTVGTIPNSAIVTTGTARQAATKPPVVVKPVITSPDSNNTVVPQVNDAKYAVNNTVTAPVSTAPVVKSNNPDKQPVKTKTAPAVNSMEALFVAEKTMSKKADRKPVDDKKVKFGIYAATFFNYAKGSANQVNAGAGFTSDIKLTNNLKLSTGVALAQNTLKYNSNTPPNANAAMAVTYAASLQDKMLTPASTFPVYKNYNANLVGLDVPINIKYEFNPQKTDAFISAGLSSGTFINEAYTTSYASPQSNLLPGLSQQTSQETSRQSFNGFYFARTLNVSVGVGTALGKNRLIIEPFLKYPLQGMGAQQIKFGAGGLNLKFNFSTIKK